MSASRWWSSPRWVDVERSYSAKDIASFRNSIKINYPSAIMARKLWALLTLCTKNQTFSHTYGPLDPVQVVNLTKYLTTIYVSGWQCSSTASTTHEPGPDFADYPANTVPHKVTKSPLTCLTKEIINRLNSSLRHYCITTESKMKREAE